MKRIQVITRHAVANYGSLLQTYATEKVLRSLGYDVQIINYIPKREQSWRLAQVRSNTNGINGQNPLKQWLFLASQMLNYSVSYQAFKGFRSRLINETPLYSSLPELEASPPQADIYLTGSDQVWGRMGPMPYDRAYFLDFVPDNAPRVAYSASFGREHIEIDAETLQGLLQKYKEINVREASAVDILNTMGFDSVNHVLDPTLLLDSNDWRSLATSKDTDNPKGNYILVYQLNRNKTFENYANRLGDKLGLPVIRLSCSMNSLLQKGKLVYLPSPEALLNYFNNASYVLTDSFHATVFSLIFNRQFIVFSPGKTSTRIKSILGSLELDSQFREHFDDYDWTDQIIDYASVNSKLDAMRATSKSILKQSLEMA